MSGNSAAPSNHNPDVSVLSGGAGVQITPVQGGGGGDGAPPGYNPEQSVLHGGNATILPVQGGGAGGAAAAAEPLEPRVEFYSMDAIDTHRFRDPILLTDTLDAYMSAAKESWKSIKPSSRDPSERAAATANRIPVSLDKCAAAIQKQEDEPVLTAMHQFRLATYLDEECKTIIVVPPLKGRVDLLRKVIRFLQYNMIMNETRRLAPDVAVICLSPVYASIRSTLTLPDPATLSDPAEYDTLVRNQAHQQENIKKANLELFTILTELRVLNPRNFFSLVDYSPDTITSACLLTLSIPDAIINTSTVYNPFNTTTGATTPATTPHSLFEPSYIVSQQDSGTVVLSAAIGTEPTLPVAHDSIQILDLDPEKDKTYSIAIEPMFIAPAAAPADPTAQNAAKPDTMLVIRGVPHPKAAANQDPAVDPSEVASRSPLCKDTFKGFLPIQSFPQGYYAKEDAERQQTISIFRFDTTSTSRIFCEESVHRTIAAEELERSFQPAPPAELTPSSTRRVPFRGRSYHIREATDDWRDGRFTQDEAAFLNAIGLIPQMVRGAMPSDWVEQLARFLGSVSATRCFDSRLASHIECRQGRRFIERVIAYTEEQNILRHYLRDVALNLEKEAQEARRIALLREQEQQLKRRSVSGVPGFEDGYLPVDDVEWGASKTEWGAPNLEERISTPGTYIGYLLIATRESNTPPTKVMYEFKASDIDSANQKFVEKIESDREKYPLFLFLY